MRKRQRGFTLVEIMLVVSILSLLAVMAAPGFIKYKRKALGVSVGTTLKTFGEAFTFYYLHEGLYPADTHITLPPGMEGYLRQSQWDQEVLGGNFNWEGPSWGEGGSYDYAGIALFGITASVKDLAAIDEFIDDGNLSTGIFRQTDNGRYTYIIQEQPA